MVAVGVSGKPQETCTASRPHGRRDALALVDDALEILVVHFLLLVGDLEEGLVDILKLLIGEGEAELAHAMAQRRVAASGGEDDLRSAGAHVRRVDDLVGVARLEDTVLVDARGVGEGVGAHDRLVGLHLHAGNGAHELGSAGELLGHDVGMRVELGPVHADRHDDLFERRVARALAETVDGALDLRGTVADGLDGERRRHAEVVVGVDGDRGILDAVDALTQIGDAGTEGPRHVVPRGIGVVHNRRARLNGSLDDAHEEVLIGATGILGVELDVVDEVGRELDGVDSPLNRLVLREMQLVVQVARAHTKTGVDAWAFCGLERLGGDLDILVDRAGQTAHHAGVARNAPDLGHALEVTRGGDGEAGLDHVDVHADELPCDNEFLLGIHACAGRLLAVSERGIEDVDLAGHAFLLVPPRSTCAKQLARWHAPNWALLALAGGVRAVSDIREAPRRASRPARRSVRVGCF